MRILALFSFALWQTRRAHKKIPRLESRALKLWDKVDRMYKYKQKRNEDQKATNANDTDK